ncbi:hypothetical protein ACFS32_09490 [Novosphingobium pokkalii]|uniref:hypothetical protein n=1 Tax=Novosphingobium pokkalii TaxID=1770194 RepID=UPI003628324A
MYSARAAMAASSAALVLIPQILMAGAGMTPAMWRLAYCGASSNVMVTLALISSSPAATGLGAADIIIFSARA